MSESTRQTLITTRFGKYVWYPALMVVDFIQPGKKTPLVTLYIKIQRNNTELGATLLAATHMLSELKKEKAARRNIT